MLQVELEGPYPAWHTGVQRGRVVSSDGLSERVLVVLGTRVEPERAAAVARREGQPALSLLHDRVLQLRTVQTVGNRAAWVYEHQHAVGVGHLTRDPYLLPQRAAAELVAEVVDVLRELGPVGMSHPGPEANDLLLLPDGTIRIAGFTSPYAKSPALRPPDGSEGEPALTYRLGVLLAQLLSGVTPPPSGNAAAHDAQVRRTLIRAMSRPGPAFGERYGEWLRAMLAWRADARPPLSTLAAGLREVASHTGGASLASWARNEVERIHRETEKMRPATDVDPDVHDMQPVWPPSLVDDPEPHSIEEPITAPLPAIPISDLAETDDHTVESEAARRTPAPAGAADNRPIPVSVGPPPAAVRATPSLPASFLDGDGPEAAPPPSLLARTWPYLLALLMAGAGAGLALFFAMVLLAVLYF